MPKSKPTLGKQQSFMFTLPLHLHKSAILLFSIILLFVVLNDGKTEAQDPFKEFSATSVFREVNADTVSSAQKPLVNPWWDRHVQNSLREVQPLPADLHTICLLYTSPSPRDS